MASTTEVKTEAPSVQLKAKPPTIYRKDYTPTVYDIRHYDFDFKLDRKETKLVAKITLYRREGQEHGVDLKLDGIDIRLVALHLDDKALSTENGDYTLTENDLTVKGSLLPKECGVDFILTCDVRICPETNLELSGLYTSKAILCTQCESEGFRRIIFSLDRPDVLSTFKCRLQAQKALYPILLSNGNLIEEAETEGGEHFTVWEDPFRKPAYLFAIVAGDLHEKKAIYQHPNKKDGKKVKIGVYCETADSEKLDWAVESIKRAMAWDEDKYGLEYDLDNFNLVAVRDFNYGAMENKSLNIFVSSLLLATKDTATDRDYLRVLGVIGHEYFHNWTGDRVTCRDWFQLTLKEGLTVFRDQEFSRDQGSAAVKRIDDVDMLRTKQFAEDAGPTAHPIRPDSYIGVDNFYTVTVYEKGAEVIRMYNTIVGEAGFRKGMDLYFKRHDGSAVTCDDFRAAIADANDVDLSQFERWYSQVGTPTLEVVEAKYDATTKIYTLAFRQTIPVRKEQPDPKPMHIPITVGLIGRTTKKEILASTVLEMKEANQVFELKDVSEECVPSILRDFSAPVKLLHEVTDEDLAFLMANDTDDFNRWESAQKLFTRLFLQRYKEASEGNSTSPLPEILSSSLVTFLKSDAEKALIARAISLPSEEELTLSVPQADPCLVSTVRRDIVLQVREILLPELKKQYESLSAILKREYAPEPADMAERQMLEVCLHYICADRTPESAAFALSHFKNSSNLTDRMAALGPLIHIKSPERTEALEIFLNSANGDEQVIDKWFALQARSDYPEILKDVKKIKETHELFNLKTPPRMRALIYVFATNRKHFHSADGLGYEFIADTIIEVNRFNAIVGSKLCGYLINWKCFDTKRQDLMKTQLQRILKSEGLSRDAYELVSKSLEQE